MSKITPQVSRLLGKNRQRIIDRYGFAALLKWDSEEDVPAEVLAWLRAKKTK